MASLHCKLEEQLTCSVCLEQLKDPKALPCLHSFCHHCLLKIIKNGKIICPECRKSVEIGNPPDISFLPSNFFVNNLLETMSGEKEPRCDEGDVSTATSLPCEHCETGGFAEYQCLECSLSLCRLCIECHTLSESTRSHSILPLDEMDATTMTVSNVVTLGCSKHNNNPFSIFCTLCQVAICEVCAEKTHREHKCLLVEEIAEKEKDETHDLLEKVKIEKDQLYKRLLLVRKKEESLLAKKEAVIPEIASYFEELTRIIESRKAELIDQATLLIQTRQKELVDPREYLELRLTRCDNIIRSTEEMFAKGDDAELLIQKASILKCLNSLASSGEEKKPIVDDFMQFVTEYSVKEIGEKILKRCHVLGEVASPEISTASFSSPKCSILVGKASSVSVLCKDKLNQKMKSGGQLITPMFTGIKVKDVSVRDNNNGSYDIKFTAQEVGTVNLQVLINGHPALKCSLSKKVSWVLRENIGSGTLSDCGLILTGERAFGSWCYRVGDCCFETGLYSWKVEIKYLGSRSMLSFKKEVAVGVVDCDGDLSYSAIKSGATKKWAAKCSAEVVIVVKLDMGHRRLSVQFTGGVDERNRSIAPSQFSFDITATRVCPYLALQGKQLSLSVIQI